MPLQHKTNEHQNTQTERESDSFNRSRAVGPPWPLTRKNDAPPRSGVNRGRGGRWGPSLPPLEPENKEKKITRASRAATLNTTAIRKPTLNTTAPPFPRSLLRQCPLEPQGATNRQPDDSPGVLQPPRRHAPGSTRPEAAGPNIGFSAVKKSIAPETLQGGHECVAALAPKQPAQTLGARLSWNQLLQRPHVGRPRVCSSTRPEAAGPNMEHSTTWPLTAL